MKVALFTHHFLEPTHHAIADVLTAMHHHTFHVFAKRLTDRHYFDIPNVASRHFYTKGDLACPELDQSDLVHAIYDGKTAFRAGRHAQRLGKPFVLSYHGGFDTNAKIFDERYMVAARESTESATAVTVPSHADIERLRQIGVRREVHVLPVPIDTGIIPQRKPPDVVHLVMVARLVEKKGFDISLRAMTRLPSDVYLSVVGDGFLYNDLRALAQALNVDNRVAWHGLLPLTETLDLLAKSSILLHPSRRASDGNADGVPQIILWAMATGVPVIATATGSINELVKHEQTGFIIPPEDPQALANAVSRCLTDTPLTNAMCARAMSYAVTHHALINVAERLNAIYRECVHD